MGLSTEDIEKLSQDVYTERRIGHSLHCGRCGYNLRTLPYIGRCPECGNEYNARPAILKGIHVPADVRFPTVELLGAVFFLVSGTGWFVSALTPLAPPQVTLAAIVVIAGLISAWSFRRQLGRFLQFRAASRDDDDD
jgi:hypothetical protein